uniref:Protein kinase domain-containing protein n=1 Tax=Prymnesium polylepis TaxID=72548 RepID=A0A6T7WWV2_9EUKA|mmetsp:Transcript_13505/g.34453  ORF Transcript_13505/g.34453 Transcript_13505/m.34453 type:complete len:138 (+) Transcript_13505:1-414(+)
MTRVGSLLWAAPELLRGLKYDTTCDQWSFAVVLWEMLTGQMPYKGMSSTAIARDVALGNHRLPLPARGPKPLLRIIAACFSTDASQRPKCKDIAAGLDAIAAKLAQQPAVAAAGGASCTPIVAGVGSSGAVVGNTVT